jgi:hypothetical protein
VSTPVDSDRCVQLTICFQSWMPDVSAHSTPLPRVGGTPGFTPERRFGELALHCRAFLPDRFLRSVPLVPRRPFTAEPCRCCGLPLEHRLRVVRQHPVSSGRPAATRARSSERSGSHGSRPVGLDAFIRPRVNAVELRTPKIPFPFNPFPRPTARSWLSERVPRAERSPTGSNGSAVSTDPGHGHVPLPCFSARKTHQSEPSARTRSARSPP